MKRYLKPAVISLSSILSIATLNNAYATSYQVFTPLTYNNPAALNSVKKGELIIGNTALFSRFHFTGTAAGMSGSTTSRTQDALPYGRIAMRLSPKVVVGVDISQPIYTDIRYPRDSIVRFFATETFIRDTNYSPRISYQVNPCLAVGLGFDANQLWDGQLNFVVPPFGVVVNRATSWAYGWDAGIFYMLTSATFLNLSYFSQIIQHAEGTSTWGPFENKGLNASVKLPATVVANVIRMVSPKWALSATARYTHWNILRYTVIQNTALGVPVIIPDHFYDNISTQIATHYQINTKWGILGSFDYEPNVQPTATRSVGLPTYNRYIPVIGGDYTFMKGLKATLAYGHVFSKPPIDTALSNGLHIHGRERVNVDIVDFSVTYDV